ncbi:MAG: hypothetical protein AAF559_13090 [Pseudomonadota bacterium]
MKFGMFWGASASAVALLCAPVAAQDEAMEPAQPQPTADAAVETVTPEAATPDAPAPKAAAPAKPCELHVWPTDNYIGVKMGLLSGFGPVGAVLDAEGNKDEVKSVKDLMREYLGPDIQMQELEKLDYMQKLGLDPDRYEVIMQEPTPFYEEIKKDKAKKAEVKAFNKTMKGSKRLTGSTADCYAELVTTHIFYHKAMMYGSNLFTGWNYREFEGAKVTARGKGQVKNPLEEFPPKEPEMVPVAQEELRDAYSKDFAEWTEKKLTR